jgi:hypothetical protein
LQTNELMSLNPHTIELIKWGYGEIEKGKKYGILTKTITDISICGNPDDTDTWFIQFDSKLGNTKLMGFYFQHTAVELIYDGPPNLLNWCKKTIVNFSKKNHKKFFQATIFGSDEKTWGMELRHMEKGPFLSTCDKVEEVFFYSDCSVKNDDIVVLIFDKRADKKFEQWVEEKINEKVETGENVRMLGHLFNKDHPTNAHYWMVVFERKDENIIEIAKKIF